MQSMHHGGDLNLGERHSRVTWHDGTVMLRTLRTAMVLSCNCCADFGHCLKKAMSHSQKGGGGHSTTTVKTCTSHWGLESPAFRHHLKKSPTQLIADYKELEIRT